MEQLLRADKMIASQSTLSRREIARMIAAGQVLLNGEPLRSAAQKVSYADRISVDGRELALKQYVYLMMNKPAGVVSATENERQANVISILPPEYLRPGLFPAGRLDKDTTGFVLITNDGAFAHRILSPKSHVPKTYLLTVDAPLSDDSLRRIREGLATATERFRPARAEEIAPCRYRLVLTEGKYHEVKRMTAACGAQLLALHRCAIGALSLDEALPAGGVRELTAEEKELISEAEHEPV